MSGRRRTDGGQSAVLLLLVVAVMGVALAGALADFGGLTQQRTRAQSVADATALASVVEGRAAAVATAQRNGAELVSWSVGPGPHEVTVVVRVGDATATARASDAP